MPGTTNLIILGYAVGYGVLGYRLGRARGFGRFGILIGILTGPIGLVAMALAPRDRPRRPGGRGLTPFLLAPALAVAVVAPSGCSASTVRDAAVSRLAIGTWRCTIDPDDDGYPPLVVEVDRGGTFEVGFERTDAPSAPPSHVTGTWKLDHGDLDWRLDVPVGSEQFLVRDFDSLTLDSREFTLQEGGLLDSTFDRAGGSGPEHRIEVRAQGTDSVTFRERGGDPWTCDRQ